MNIATDTLTQDCRKFIEWFNEAKAGDRYVYHRGALLQGLPAIKHTVWKYATQGKVYLFQKKIGPDEYDYILYKVGVRDKRFIPFDYWNEGKRPYVVTRRKLNGQEK